MTEYLGSDSLDGGTDQSSRARSTMTIKVRECSGDGIPAGFVGGADDVVGGTDVLALGSKNWRGELDLTRDSVLENDTGPR